MNWTPVVIVVVLWAAAAASLGIFALWEGRRADRDAENERVAEWGDVLRAEEVERLARARRAAEFAWLLSYVTTRIEARRGPGRHRAVGLTDANRAAIRSDTRELAIVSPTQARFALVLTQAGETPPQQYGPREITGRVIDGLPTLTEVAR